MAEAQTEVEQEERLLRSLGDVQLFSGVSHKGLRLVAEISRQASYKVGQYIFREGEPGDALYLITAGKVRISRDVAGMGEEALAILAEGDAFGEMSLIDESPRSADAKVHESCELLVIKKEALEDLLFLEKDLAYELLWNFVRTLSKRLRETNNKMTFLSITGKF